MAAPATLLTDIANALTRLHELGVQPVLRHNAVLTDHGYVLPTDHGWTARMKTIDPHLTVVTDPDDE